MDYQRQINEIYMAYEVLRESSLPRIVRTATKEQTNFLVSLENLLEKHEIVFTELIRINNRFK